MFKRSMNPKDIVSLLGKLKTKTPEYPTDLLAARKAAFMKQAISINIQPKGPGGQSGSSGSGASSTSGGSGISGAGGGTGMLGSLSAAQTLLLQATIGVWLVAAMLTAAYVFRNQIVDLLQNYGIVNAEVLQAPSIEPTSPALVAPATEVIATETPPTEAPTTTVNGTPGNSLGVEATPDGSPIVQEGSTDTTDGSGRHLGQTPGPPDVSGEGNPQKPEKTKAPKK